MRSKKAVLLAVLSLPLVLAGATASAQPFNITLSSGLFAVPENAKSVEWAVVNNSAVPRAVRVTVYRHLIGFPRAIVVPGPITVTLAPNEITHNANSVGSGEPFELGPYYEVQLESNNLRVMPIVDIWGGFNNTTAIPGTRIPARSWVRIR